MILEGGARTSTMKFVVALGVFTLWWGLFSHADGAEADLVMLTDAPKQVLLA